MGILRVGAYVGRPGSSSSGGGGDLEDSSGRAAPELL